MKAVAALVLAAAVTGCSARKPALTPTFGIAPDHSYIDVEPGWRLRVLTPLLRSGGFRVGASEQTMPNSGTQPSVELRTDSDFLGYELAYYSVEPKGRIRLTSVEETINARTEPRQKPAAKLFESPRDARFVRLLFLTRVSQADHDMAVLTARRVQDLALWTPKLQAEPEATCKATPYCSWVPAGIAVTAERRDPQTGAWIPADRAGRPRSGR